jgi:hypothetical protein
MTFTITAIVPDADPITESGELPDGLEPLSFLKQRLARFLYVHSDVTWTTLQITFTA